MKRLRPVAVLGDIAVSIVLSVVVVLAIATEAAAQHPGSGSTAPPPPAGNGTLTVSVLYQADPMEAIGIPIALYALSSDGTPGFANGQTNVDGVYAFRGISTDPGIVYLVGARFMDIPFAKRVTFVAGETEARIEIEVKPPTDRTDSVSIDELRIRIDWRGDRIVVHEILRLLNAGDRVVQMPTEDPTRSIVTRRLGPAARDFSAGAGSIENGLRLEDGLVQFSGPLYPGEQRVEYRYSLPIPDGPEESGALRVPVQLEEAAARIVVVAGTDGLEVRGPKLIPSSEVLSDSDQSLDTWARAGLAANEVFELELTLPESRLDPTLLSIPRGNIWLELDDTRLTASVEIEIEVEPGAPIAGLPSAPLLHVSIPDGATLNGVAPESEALGLVPTGDPQEGKQDNVGFDVVGPIGAGKSILGYSYSMPARPEGVELDMRFPGELHTLNVLIADTGLALESSRLHRRRPFRSGTRNYLHREAFNIARGEVVDLSLVPIGASGVPQSASIALAIAAAAGGAFFLFAPLRSAERETVAPESPMDRIQAKRESIYSAIRDLDHDFETAKLEEDDYNQMRDRLRADAIELLRSERDMASVASVAAREERPAGSPSAPFLATAESGEPQTGAFCPICGETVAPNWRFCSHCGGDLSPAEETSG